MQEVISWGWKVQKIASITQYHPDPVKHALPWRRKKRLLVDEIVRGRPTIRNMIVAVLKSPQRRER